jgi:ABC-type transporter Mla subunit MlaD
MYGDTTAIRHRAHDLRRAGDLIRDEADQVAHRAAAVPWQGVAADAMRAAVRRRVGALRDAARLHDAAAARLDEHADAVDRVKQLIAAIERRVLALVAAARDRLSGLLGVVGAVIDPVDELLDRFVPPPSGHRDWLLVDRPGLELRGLDLPGLAA